MYEVLSVTCQISHKRRKSLFMRTTICFKHNNSLVYSIRRSLRNNEKLLTSQSNFRDNVKRFLVPEASQHGLGRLTINICNLNLQTSPGALLVNPLSIVRCSSSTKFLYSSEISQMISNDVRNPNSVGVKQNSPNTCYFYHDKIFNNARPAETKLLHSKK